MFPGVEWKKSGNKLVLTIHRFINLNRPPKNISQKIPLTLKLMGIRCVNRNFIPNNGYWYDNLRGFDKITVHVRCCLTHTKLNYYFLPSIVLLKNTLYSASVNKVFPTFLFQCFPIIHYLLLSHQYKISTERCFEVPKDGFATVNEGFFHIRKEVVCLEREGSTNASSLYMYN